MGLIHRIDRKLRELVRHSIIWGAWSLTKKLSFTNNKTSQVLCIICPALWCEGMDVFRSFNEKLELFVTRRIAREKEITFSIQQWKLENLSNITKHEKYRIILSQSTLVHYCTYTVAVGLHVGSMASNLRLVNKSLALRKSADDVAPNYFLKFVSQDILHLPGPLCPSTLPWIIFYRSWCSVLFCISCSKYCNFLRFTENKHSGLLPILRRTA